MQKTEVAMVSSRDNILAAVKQHQGAARDLPLIKGFEQTFHPVDQFIDVLTKIGGRVHRVNTMQEIGPAIDGQFGKPGRVVSTVPGLGLDAEINQSYAAAANLHDVDLFVTRSSLGVAENGAVWLCEHDLGERVLPFISTHVVVVLESKHIVPTMHEAYRHIDNADYGFATFIAGPSKTADIEQSLVLGAHGAMTMTVFLLG